MLKKLRVKFILMMMSFTILLLGSIFGLIYHFTAADLAQSSFEMMQERPGSAPDSVRLPFFTVEVSKTGAITAAGSGLYDLSDEDFLRELVLAAQADGKNDGLLSSYHLRFFRAVTPDGEKYVFADTSAEQATLKSLIRTSVLIGLGSLAVFFALSVLLARWAVRPVELAWRQQKQFVADASHELKTPLQGIIGSAELLENGMVKQEDVPRFVGHIRKEAQRLVTLIGDIIRLSQLDEGGELPTEPVDLLTVSQEAAETLQDAAAARQVTVSVQGEPTVIPGVHRLLYEIVYNLCDNAIKYNRDGGRVDITVAHDADGSSVTVADTGIGIAPEHQARVFERFYRVDKSHSKASGGTGLGLSIVKHAVAYHHGTIALKSEVGKGTEIAVRFPQEK